MIINYATFGAQMPIIRLYVRYYLHCVATVRIRMYILLLQTPLGHVR